MIRCIPTRGAFLIKNFRSIWLRALLIALAASAGLIGCFSADFNAYDDSAHVDNPHYADAKSALDYFTPKTDTSYIPVTLLSYKIDKAIHSWWSVPAFRSWAPGVRLDNWLLHVCAALILWRLLRRLKFSEDSAYFIALIWAAHPLACETVCWVSERKNTLAALFGFAAMYTLALERRPAWRWPAACFLYALALLGKPSALGLLPLLVLIEALQIVPPFRRRFLRAGAEPAEVANGNRYVAAIAGAFGLGLISFVVLKLNLYTHSGEIIEPPGGSVFTALLTDFNIFSRYLFNVVAPVKLSAVYFVEPIKGLADPRTWVWGGVLGGVVGGTILLARSRWTAVFGWFWFFSALACNANFISIVHVMADRYIYLSTPGFLIVIGEMLAGICLRIGCQLESEPKCCRMTVARMALALAALLCVCLSVSRGHVWRNTYTVFSDAADKQPGAFYAHYGLGGAYDTLYHNAPPHSSEYTTYRAAWVREFSIAVNECPDRDRYILKNDAALLLGEYYFFAARDPLSAEKYFTIAAQQSGSRSKNSTRAVSLAYLSLFELQKGDASKGLNIAESSLALSPSDPARIAFARANIALAKPVLSVERRARLDAALSKLAEIGRKSEHRFEADALVQEIEKARE